MKIRKNDFFKNPQKPYFGIKRLSDPKSVYVFDLFPPIRASKAPRNTSFMKNI